jgi:hypothetical protein
MTRKEQTLFMLLTYEPCQNSCNIIIGKSKTKSIDLITSLSNKNQILLLTTIKLARASS